MTVTPQATGKFDEADRTPYYACRGIFERGLSRKRCMTADRISVSHQMSYAEHEPVTPCRMSVTNDPFYASSAAPGTFGPHHQPCPQQTHSQVLCSHFFAFAHAEPARSLLVHQNLPGHPQYHQLLGSWCLLSAVSAICWVCEDLEGGISVAPRPCCDGGGRQCPPLAVGSPRACSPVHP